MSRLFISHSSADSIPAIAFKQWLGANGWSDEDVFLDVEDIGGGERWKDALRKAHSRCEAVILLASPDALSSPECLTEVRKAEDFGKEIIVVLLRDLTINDHRLDSYKERQIVDLSAPPQAHVETVNQRGIQQEVHFNSEALAKVKDYLVRRGITPESFPWPPEGNPDAEPFPGLSAFTEEEAAIFFGRDADILTGLDTFRLLRRKGSPRFLAIQAASGAGKSSYLRAGLWPRLSRDPNFAPLAILRPAQGILTGPEGLGLKLAKQLSRPGASVNPGDIYSQLMAENAAKAATEFVKLMATAAAQAHDQRRIGDRDASAPAIILAIDQAEELLAPENAAESERFLVLLAGLMREPPQGVEPFGLLTVRADSATRLFQAITKQNLEAPDTLTLLPLPRTSYRDVILKPIDVVARRGQKITISPALADRLVEDANGADALPLLAFTLFQLYEGFSAGGSITLKQYEAIGGVAGSIDKALKNALAKSGDAPAIPITNEEQLTCLRATFIPWLARIDPNTGEAKRRVARLDDFRGASLAMVTRLEKVRLLVIDHHSGVDVVEVAHESLLRQWPALTGWLQEVGDDLRVVDSIERAADEWARNAKLSAWLDHRSDRLGAAERVAAREDFRRRLGNERIDYLKACRARETRQRRIAQAIAWSVAAVFAIFSILLFNEWRHTVQAQKETEASLLIAESELDLSNGNVRAALERTERAFKLIPSTPSRSALLQAVMELSPHARAVIPLGNDTGVAFAWWSDDSFDIATGSGRLRTFDSTKPAEIPIGWELPRIKRILDGNWSVVRALARIGTERMIAVFDEGSIGLYQRGINAARLHAPEREISVNPTQHAVAVGHSGALIALATADETIITYRCDWSTPTLSTPKCKSAPLGEVHGRTLAISPDEKRIAVGDRAGKVTIYDLTGNSIGSPARFDASVNALGWAEQRDWLAVGTVKGEVAVLDASLEPKPIIERQMFGDSSITALAWNPKELGLAFVCNGTAVCLWQANVSADARNAFKPAVRLEGHRNTVTRVSFAANGDRLASSATDGTIRIWSLTQDTNATSALYADETVELSKVAVSQDHQWAAAGATNGTLHFWDAKTSLPGRVIRPTDDVELRDIAWSRNGAIAGLDDNDTVNVLPGIKLQPINIPIKRRAGYHLTWTDEDRMIAVPAGDAGVVLLDPQSPPSEPVRLSDGDGKEAWGVTSIPNSRSLVISYVGGTIRIWDLASKKADAALPSPPAGHGDKIGVGSLTVSPDARLLATSSSDGSVPVYNIAKRAIWKSLKTDAREISTVAFSPDGKKLAALGTDNRLYIWTLGENDAVLYLSIGVIPRRAVVGDAAQHHDHANCIDWISEDRVAIATYSAAITVIGIDPDKWLKRIDGLALVPQAPID